MNKQKFMEELNKKVEREKKRLEKLLKIDAPDLSFLEGYIEYIYISTYVCISLKYDRNMYKATVTEMKNQGWQLVKQHNEEDVIDGEFGDLHQKFNKSGYSIAFLWGKGGTCERRCIGTRKIEVEVPVYEFSCESF